MFYLGGSPYSESVQMEQTCYVYSGPALCVLVKFCQRQNYFIPQAHLLLMISTHLMQNNHMLSDASMQRYPRIRDTGYLQCRDNSSKMLTSSGQPERCTRIKPELTPSLELEAICSLFPRVTLHATDHDGAARYWAPMSPVSRHRGER